MAIKISAKAVLTDLKEGKSDNELMEKYGLSFQRLQELFQQLVKAKLASQEYFSQRALAQSGNKPKADATEGLCPYCGYVGDEDFNECPRCGQNKAEWLDTAELTKILDGSL
jgi:rubrerythrin